MYTSTTAGWNLRSIGWRSACWSALFLGSSLLLSHNVPPLVRDVSLLGSVGMSISIVLGLRLLWAINKSGHLDRRE